jgi:hypothetical protein
MQLFSGSGGFRAPCARFSILPGGFVRSRLIVQIAR